MLDKSTGNSEDSDTFFNSSGGSPPSAVAVPPSVDDQLDFVGLGEPATPTPALTPFQKRADILVARGIPIIPLSPRSKAPCTAHAAYDATSNPVQITRWANQYPGGNSGAVARFDGFWMLDDDAGTLAAKYKADTGQDLPYTFAVKTSRGYHYYFLHDEASRLVRYAGHENSGVINIPGYKGEARCHNQYVVGPLSVHPSGAIYEVCNDAPIVAAPVQLLEWLQKAYALSESLKPDDQKPKGGNGAPDPGFRKLFDAVEYRPLVKRINSLENASVHISGLERGVCVPCPMPHHEHDDYSNCFGPLSDVPEMLHCLGKCGWSGDMVAACYQVDGGKAKYKNMYACAKAICDEEELDFNDFFPPKPEASPAEVSEPETTSPVLVVRPTLDETAYYGLAGAITKKLEPCTESHPAGILLELLVSFGNMIGRCAYYQVEDTKHFTNEFLVKVGESSRARKGTGKNRIRTIMLQVDPEWVQKRCVSGVGSGEVIIHLIRDSRQTWFVDKKTGAGKWVMMDAGVEDKRLCVSLGEFQGILSVCHRPDNLLSVVFRDGWDGVPLHNLVKTDPASCAEGLVSVLGDTTTADLGTNLTQADRVNGFANRFLWVYVYRTKLLAEGGGDMDWTAEAQQIREAAEFARGQKRIFMDESARKLWTRTLYPKLEREIRGLVGAITARASAHVIRLALLYTLLDKSDHIHVEHLEAAAAAWQYCEDSAKAIFDDLLSPDQSRIMEFLANHGPVNKKRLIHDCFRGHRKADLIQADLDMLKSRERIIVKDVNGVPWYSKR